MIVNIKLTDWSTATIIFIIKHLLYMLIGPEACFGKCEFYLW